LVATFTLISGPVADRRFVQSGYEIVNDTTGYLVASPSIRPVRCDDH